MSEQPNNLQEAPECPTDDEVLAKRDAEIARLRTDARILLANLDYMIEATGESPDPDDMAMVDHIRTALAQSSPDKPSRVGDGIAAVVAERERCATLVEKVGEGADHHWLADQIRSGQ